jgi:hypothetical protein
MEEDISCDAFTFENYHNFLRGTRNNFSEWVEREFASCLGIQPSSLSFSDSLDSLSTIEDFVYVERCKDHLVC